MSSTTTATSPTTTTDLRLPGLRSLLTAFPSSERSESAGTSPSAPRFKRRKLDAPDVENWKQDKYWQQDKYFLQCMKEQVIPHMEQATRLLPSNVDSKRIGAQVSLLITGPGSSFNEEYERGKGRLSLEYERQLAAVASREFARLAQLPEYQTKQAVPSSAPIPQPWATLDHAIINTPRAQPRPKPTTGQPPNGPLLSTSKIPVPKPTAQPIPRQAVPRLSNGPLISSSPIPLPNVSSRANNTPTSNTSGFSSAAGKHLQSAGQASKPIVIVDSDDEDDVPNKTNGVMRPASPLKKPSPVPVPKPESLKLESLQLESKATVPPKPVTKTLPPVTQQKRPSPVPTPELIVPSVEVENHAEELEDERFEEDQNHSLPDRFKSMEECYTLWSKAYGVGASKNSSAWFSSQHRPYLGFPKREAILHGTPSYHPDSPLPDGPFHVDFSPEEIGKVYAAFRQQAGQPPKERLCGLVDLQRIMKPKPDTSQVILSLRESLPHRNRGDIHAFLQDVYRKRTSKYPASLSLQKGLAAPAQAEFNRNSHTHSLLFRREISGYRGYRGMRERINFHDEFRKCREDDLEVRSEWTDCAGDIATIAWVSNDAFICGTTEHSDSHNQQYNKPGNLVLGSCRLGTLRAYPEHRIPRPIVAKGENSTDEMRESQDPWLYSSVVSSDYDAAHNRAFTSGFDRSVKVWRMDSGASMEMIGEWKHGGNVNFVAASRDASGMVATASDVATDAVRIYSIQDGVPISASPYRSYSSSRVTDAEGNTVSTEKWAYFPATMQWGLAESVKHLLLVGYSPRSRTGDDHDIPEDRLTTGELCLWDGRTGERWKVTSATTANVFEVLWHPSQDCFIAATTPIGLEIDPGVRTQIRVFRRSNNLDYGDKAFSPIKTLDCRAADINELTIMPNSYSFCYVTAGCTDGATYVWDTALGDKPLHVLRHNKPIEEFSGDREREDVGVKFTAWGTTLDRFYTGSSDGAVKVWNVRALKRPFVRDLVHVPSAVSCAMFSPDRSKLVVGDASGRVFLLSLDADDVKPARTTTICLPGTNETRTLRCPAAIIPHPEPPPPTHDANGRPCDPEVSGRDRAQAFLASRQIVLNPYHPIGAVKGPAYAETGLFRKEVHLHEDPAQPLLANWEVLQQESKRTNGGGGGKRMMRFLKPPREYQALAARHERNKRVDLDVDGLEEETRRALEREGAELRDEGEVSGLEFVEEWDGWRLADQLQ